MPAPDYKLTTDRAQSSIKSLRYEMSNLTPAAVMTFFEIDFNELLKNSAPDKKLANVQPSTKVDYGDGILRFHNNANIFNSYVIWRGNKYFPAPIHAEGFEVTSRGTLPQPTLSIASQSKDGIDQISLLRHEIRSFGDIVGAKVTRRKTYAKYLDKENFSPSEISSKDLQQLPDEYEPDPYAEMAPDIYFIERKINENKMILSYQLSSVLDLEGYKLPKRVIISDKCMWQYRGIGCWYQHPTGLEVSPSHNIEDGSDVPLLQKAELKKLPGGTLGVGLPGVAPPCSNDQDEKITALLGSSLGNDEGEWSAFAAAKDQRGYEGGRLAYGKGDYCYLLKNKIKFYFVAKENLTKEVNEKNPPPNTDYWIADECSKTLTGCRMRWGIRGSVQNDAGISSCGITKGELPFGGFPAARKVHRGA
jgi:lambda family phage minor tail protein L